MNVIVVSEGLFEITINNSSLTVNWPSDCTSLIHFVSDLPELLHYDKIETLRNLQEKYNLKSSHLVLLICEEFYPDLLVELVLQCGQNYISNGTGFSKKIFCKLISPFESDNLGADRTKLSLLDKAMDKLQDAFIITLNKAFEKKEYNIVHNVRRAITIHSLFVIAWNELQEAFKLYVNEAAEELFHRDKEITHAAIWKLCFGPVNLRYANVQKDKPLHDFILLVVDTWREKQKKQKMELRMNIGDAYWRIPYKDVQKVHTSKMDFSSMSSYLRSEVQEYLKSWYTKGENGLDISRRFHHINAITKAINIVQPNSQSFLNISYVEVYSIVDVLHQFKNSNGRKLYSVKTIHTHISEARLLFDWLRSDKNKSSIRNPFRKFKMFNIDNYVKNTDHIPEYVIQQISSAIHDCSETVQRVWIILMNTGMRASEVINLQEDCLFYNVQDNCYYLKAKSSKTIISKRKKGLDDYHTIPITNNKVIDIINNQIEDTKYLRELSGSKYIFIRNDNRITGNVTVTRIKGTNISNSINKCILRNNITDHTGKLWHYTNHQCRKTMGVRLLNEGSSIQDVGIILGHMEEKTTMRYYQDIDNLKIAELDKDLFELLFENIDADIRNTYSTQELESLKYEIMIGSRETPEGHGSCLKHVSFGPCKKKSCVGCSLLLTGPQKLTMWINLRNEQLEYLDSLGTLMRTQGIEDYETYRDYQQEVHLLNLYQDTINKIEKFIQERIPNYEST